MDPREPVRTPEDLATLNEAEVVEGYVDAMKGESEPGGNRSRSYWHGWRNGDADRNNRSDRAQRELARSVIAALSPTPPPR